MPKKLAYLINNFLVGFVITILLWSPDFILKFFTSACRTDANLLFFGQLFLLSFLLTFCKNHFLFFTLLGLVFIGEIIQLCHIAYMGMPINPLTLYKVTEDIGEVFETGVAYFGQVYFVFLILGTCYALAGYLYLKSYSKLLKIPFLPILFVALAVQRANVASKRDCESYYPSPVRHSLHNSINAFTFHFFGHLRGQEALKINYKPYTAIKKSQGVAKNVVLIMGESMRYDHMSLFGYRRPTTPFLKSLSSEASFIFKPAISGGTCTSVALPVFINLMREPGHLDLLKDKTVNLLRLAKENGYKTIWISAQESKLLYRIGTSIWIHSSRQILHIK